ncbi:P-loop NTPase fold protein [Candidatus Berkiella aquae]|uniref:KAP family NTPase n=1 Tax=Candidatus Berkiella aquae TaxID=295108 RepID=A0A0Q9YX48_9GAMM|nr:P-loop NTPase fold protein [Candidatus Berkiella aquae]MCS5711470.1 KAP family NTPase [Candidatus Berkiella aquae]
MHKKTFSNYDKLDRKKIADRLTKIIIPEIDLLSDSYVLSLNGNYGAGKTTFIEMWQNDIKDFHHTITINAWETDFAEDPLLPIIEALSKIVDDQTQSALYDAAFLATSIGSQFLQKTLNFDFDKAANDLQETKDKKSGKLIIENFTRKKRALANLKDSLDKFIAGSNKKLFVFIDELDRTRPDYAIRFLETIKHFFSIKGVIFVLAINKLQLFNSMRQMYGSDLDAPGYFKRFITNEVNIPVTEKNDIELFVSSLLSTLPEIKINASNHIPFISYIFHTFNLSLREIEYCLRGFQQITKGNRTEQGYLNLAIFLLCMSIKEPEFYNGLKTNSFETIGFIKELEGLFRKNKFDPLPKIISIVVLGSINKNNFHKLMSLFNDEGIRRRTERSSEKTFKDYTFEHIGNNLDAKIYGPSFPYAAPCPIIRIIEKIEYWKDISDE